MQGFEKYLEKEYVMGHVYPCLRPAGSLLWPRNPHEYTKKFLDMEIYYRVSAETESQVIDYSVTNDLMIQLGLFPDDLCKLAEANARENAEIRELNDYLTEMVTKYGDDLKDIVEDRQPEEEAKRPIYIATTNDGWHGAGVITCTDVLDRVAEKSNSPVLLVIPSSVHEVLVLPFGDDTPTISHINRLIGMVNSDVLDQDDRLSDHCYIYDSKRKTFTMTFADGSYGDQTVWGK